MPLSDTIDAIIKESTGVERELRWFMSALRARCRQLSQPSGGIAARSRPASPRAPACDRMCLKAVQPLLGTELKMYYNFGLS